MNHDSTVDHDQSAALAAAADRPTDHSLAAAALDRDRELARRLTEAVLATEGVTAVFPSQPLVHAATVGIAAVIDLPKPDVQVEVARSDAFVTITAHIATAASLPAPDVLRSAAASLRAALSAETDSAAGQHAILVKARLVEDARGPASPSTSDALEQVEADAASA